MGKPAASPVPPGPPQYRDDPDAVSLRTTRSDYEYDDAPDLPSYSDSEAAASSSGRHGDGGAQEEGLVDRYAAIPEASTSGWRSQSHSSGNIVTGSETSIRMDERLEDPTELHNYVTNCLSLLPPKIQIRIRGFHEETVHRNNKKEKNTVVDFDMTFSLNPLLPEGPTEQGWQSYLAQDSDRAYRGSWRKTRAQGYKQDVEVGGEQPQSFETWSDRQNVVVTSQGYLDLMRWMTEYCESKAKLKVFRLSREVTGLDTEYLQTSIERLIRGTDYRGHIGVSFPVADRNVDIYNVHWVNAWRTSWIRYIFYFTFLWIFTWPLLFFLTKRWEVYTIQWCNSFNVPTVPGQIRKMYSRMSELWWFEHRANLIRRLAQDRFQGDASDLPLDTQPADDRRRSTGNVNVDAAVSLVQGGLDVWRTVQRGGRQEVGGWGADS